MPFSVNLMRKLDTVDAGLKDVLWSILDEIERNREESVTKREFSELSEIVKQIGQTTRELAEAQQRTEQKVGELAEAQQQGEIRLSRLESVVAELAEAQKRTEQELRALVREHKETRKQVGGLTITVGYGLEDKAYVALPTLLKRDFGLIVQGRLLRDYVKDQAGNELEVNIFGKAVKDGEEVVIVGESKSQLSRNEVDKFIKKKLARLAGVFPEIFPLMVTNMISSSEVKAYLQTKGIALYYSYDFS